jgi:hypothetical protein
MAHDMPLPTLDPIILTVPGLTILALITGKPFGNRRFPIAIASIWAVERSAPQHLGQQAGLAIQRAESAGRPVVLVAHSLGCLAVAWWAEYERLANGLRADLPVIGALLVAPPDVEDGVRTAA